MVGRKVLWWSKLIPSTQGELRWCDARYFASAILMFPAQILSYLGSATGMRFFNDFADSIAHGQAPLTTSFSVFDPDFQLFLGIDDVQAHSNRR